MFITRDAFIKAGPFKKALAVLAFALVALVGIQPSAATAADNTHTGYVPNRTITITGLPIPGGTIVIIFAPGSFRPGEHVTVIVGGRTVGGGHGHGVTLGALKAEVPGLDKEASADGSLKVTMTLPEDAAGTQTITATGAESGNVGTAATTVVPQDVAPNVAPAAVVGTSAPLPLLLAWIGAGALILGAAAAGTLAFVRRQRRVV
jgi:hypothetical protein